MYDIRSSMGIDFPKAPYIGQVHYDFDLKRTFRYEEKDFRKYFSTLDMFHWVDITEKDLFDNCLISLSSKYYEIFHIGKHKFVYKKLFKNIENIFKM